MKTLLNIKVYTLETVRFYNERIPQFEFIEECFITFHVELHTQSLEVLVGIL